MKSLFILVFLFGIACHTTSPTLEETSTGKMALGPDGGPTCPTPSSLATALASTSSGAILDLGGTDPTTCPEIGMTQTWGGGAYVFSDSPESPKSSGKLYEDGTLAATPNGTNNRIFVYHVNGESSGHMRMTVLITNTSASAGTLTVQQHGMAGPSTSYLYAGKIAVQRWLSSTALSPVQVAAGAAIRLDTTFDTTSMAPNYLLNGIWDYTMTQSHKVTICALKDTDNPLTVCPGLSILPRDTHQRGTFPNADKIYNSAAAFDTAAGMQQFPIAGNTTNDSNAVGTDITDGSQQVLGGNYGICYRIHLTNSSSDGHNFGFLINPRGGAWGGAVNAAPGLLAGGVFLIPPATGSISLSTQGGVEGEYNPASTPSPWIQFMPTGGSSFPVRFVAAPY